MALEWTPETLSVKTSKELQQILANAGRRGRGDVVDMCSSILEQRLGAGRSHMTVAEFHFVCDNDTGVQTMSDGTFTTGVWVVADAHRVPSLRDKAMVALHSAKVQSSYRQGIVVGWEDVPRDEFGEGTGVRFTIQPTNIALPWMGGGSGEKGYLWRERKPTMQGPQD